MVHMYSVKHFAFALNGCDQQPCIDWQPPKPHPFLPWDNGHEDDKDTYSLCGEREERHA